MLCCCKDPDSPPVSPTAKHAPAQQLASKNAPVTKSAQSKSSKPTGTSKASSKPQQGRHSKSPDRKTVAKSSDRVVNPASVILTEKSITSVPVKVPAKMAATLEHLVTRLEAVTSRLEGVAGATGGATATASAPAVSGTFPLSSRPVLPRSTCYSGVISLDRLINKT